MTSSNENHRQLSVVRGTTFENVLHKGSRDAVGMSAMMKKNYDAQQAASDEYFKHWTSKTAESETEETREVRHHSIMEESCCEC